MKMKAWFGNHVWEILWCLILGISLSVITFAGYEIEDSKASSLMAVGAVCAVCTILLFVAGYNRLTMMVGIASAVILIFTAVIVVRRNHELYGGRIDGNPALFWIVTVGVSAVCYLLSRWRISIVVLLVVGSVLSAAFGFLEYPVRLPAFLGFVFAIILMFLYRVYHQSLLASYTGSVRFSGYMLQSMVLILAVLLMAGAVYAGIVRPLHPPTHPLKLITRLQSLEILEQVGVSRRTEVDNPEQATSNENDEMQMSNQKKEKNDDRSHQEKKDNEKQGGLQQHLSKEKAQAVNYHRSHTWLFVLLSILIPLGIAMPFLLRYLRIKRWEKKVKEAGFTDGATMIYLYLLKKIRFAGFTKPPEVTLLKYMKGQKKAMKSFAVGSTDFMKLTRLYQRALYGYSELNASEFERFWRFYVNFRPCMKKRIGKAKYALYYFFI